MFMFIKYLLNNGREGRRKEKGSDRLYPISSHLTMLTYACEEISQHLEYSKYLARDDVHCIFFYYIF